LQSDNLNEYYKVRKIQLKKKQRKFIKRLSSDFNGIKKIKCLSLFAWLMMFMCVEFKSGEGE
jgi:hypothetical protein